MWNSKIRISRDPRLEMTSSKISVLPKDLLTAPANYRKQWKLYRIVVASFATNTGQAANSHKTELLNVPLSVTLASINNQCFSSYWSFAHLDKRLHDDDLSTSGNFLILSQSSFELQKNFFFVKISFFLCSGTSAYFLLSPSFEFVGGFFQSSVHLGNVDTKRKCFRF